MPFPLEYSRARDDFYDFMLEVREASGLTSSHQTYTMVQGVFQAFRRRLSLEDAIRFSNALPVGLRALFVDQWDVDEPRKAFTDDTVLLKEVRALRQKHNFSPDHALEAVARTLWKHVDRVRFEDMLAQLPGPAQAFWRR
ncbi:DUF2267 domain-containing protein [Pseudohaliea sp.]|uniref:DUF2267 domain-containing protein n=1 Tax=Pseudohaliea sp. TaxID=2740289 RepID=UPI0032ED2833